MTFCQILEAKYRTRQIRADVFLGGAIAIRTSTTSFNPSVCHFSGQQQSAGGPTASAPAPTEASTEGQNSGYSVTTPAPSQESATSSDSAQSAGSSSQGVQQQQGTSSFVTAAYSAARNYASAPQAADAAYSAAQGAQAPTTVASYGPSQSLLPQSSYVGSTNTAASVAGLHLLLVASGCYCEVPL